MNNFPRELRHDSGHPMVLDATRLMLSLTRPAKAAEIGPMLKSVGLVLEDAGDRTGDSSHRAAQAINYTNLRLWVRNATGDPIDQKQFEAVEARLGDLLNLAEPVYRLVGAPGRFGLLCPFSNVLLLKAARSGDEGRAALLALAERLGLKEWPEKSKLLGEHYYFLIRDPRKANAYQLRALLMESERKLVDSAFLENMPLLSHYAMTPNDTNFGSQWNMTKIQAEQAWDLSTGTAGVVICIFDSGCELTHPDLTMVSNGLNAGTMGNGSPSYNQLIVDNGLPFHGTACAGVAAAKINNSLGVAGLAGGCRVLPVAFDNGTDAEVVTGINYAVSQSAKVLSMSFGNGFVLDSQVWNIALIDAAITAADAAGVFMTAATHNQNTLEGITYPAVNSKVVACGASDSADNRWSVSNYGTAISVVAPGEDMWTTDLLGGAGKNPQGSPDGDYYNYFHHTSAATPHVAGLAGLLFSKYPSLTSAKVREIIERTAE